MCRSVITDKMSEMKSQLQAVQASSITPIKSVDPRPRVKDDDQDDEDEAVIDLEAEDGDDEMDVESPKRRSRKQNGNPDVFKNPQLKDAIKALQASVPSNAGSCAY